VYQLKALIGLSQQCVCNGFHLDSYGGHLQTFQSKSVDTQTHDWFVDLERKEYVVFQKTQELDDLLPPPRTLIMDFTLTHTRYGRSNLHLMGQLNLSSHYLPQNKKRREKGGENVTLKLSFLSSSSRSH
jgi:hypothetical protein